MLFNVISRTPFFFFLVVVVVGSYPSVGGYCQCILSPTDKAQEIRDVKDLGLMSCSKSFFFRGNNSFIFYENIPNWIINCHHHDVVLLAQICMTLFHHLSLSPSLPAGLLDYLLCPYQAVVDKFLLVSQHLHIHVKGSIGERCLWVCPYFSDSVLHVLFVLFGWFLRWEVSICTTAVLWDVTSWICSIFVQFLSSFFSICLVIIRVVNLCHKIDMITAWKKLHFILSDKSDFHMIDNLSIAVLAFTRHILTSNSVDEMLLPRYVNLYFKEPPASAEMSPFWLKHMYFVLSAFTWRPMPHSYFFI